MLTLTAAEARNQLNTVLYKAIKRYRVIGITCKQGSAVLISRAHYEGLKETLGLLTSPGILRNVRRAKKDIAAHRTVSMKKMFP